jgi:predicted SAM-dependent methyltransferase
MCTQEELKLVIGAGGYNKGEDWIHTEETELNLMKEKGWQDDLN